MKKFLVFALIFVLSITVFVGCGSNETAQNDTKQEAPKQETPKGFVPEKDFEFVVPYSAGGGSDVNARVLIDAANKHNLLEKNVLVVNKPGGSGAVGNTYTASKKDDAYTIMTFNSGQMMSTIANNAEVKLQNLTPIGTLALDTLLLVTNAESNYKTFEELVDGVKAEPEAITIGGTGKGSEDHLAALLINMEVGVKFKYVPFNGGGDVMSALLGGHIDAAIFNPSEIGSQLEAGKAIAVASYAKDRLGKPFDQIPTFKELDFPNINFVMFRGYAGPPEMPADAVKYWEGILSKVSEVNEWKVEYVEKNGLINVYMGAEESKKFYEEEAKKYEQLLKAAEVIK